MVRRRTIGGFAGGFARGDHLGRVAGLEPGLPDRRDRDLGVGLGLAPVQAREHGCEHVLLVVQHLHLHAPARRDQQREAGDRRGEGPGQRRLQLRPAARQRGADQRARQQRHRGGGDEQVRRRIAGGEHEGVDEQHREAGSDREPAPARTVEQPTDEGRDDDRPRHAEREHPRAEPRRPRQQGLGEVLDLGEQGRRAERQRDGAEEDVGLASLEAGALAEHDHQADAEGEAQVAPGEVELVEAGRIEPGGRWVGRSEDRRAGEGEGPEGAEHGAQGSEGGLRRRISGVIIHELFEQGTAGGKRRPCGQSAM